VKSFIESEVEYRANLIDRRRRMPQFLKYRTAINIMKEIIMLIRFIREAPNISKYISDPAATFPFRGDTNDITGSAYPLVKLSMMKVSMMGFYERDSAW